MNLIENAIDSFEHALEHYFSKKPNDFKYAVLHFHHAISLILKSRLAKEHFSLIYIKPEHAQNLNASTVGLDLSLDRLRVIPVDLNDEDKNQIKYLQKVRNQIEHHKFEINKNEIEACFSKTFSFMKKFIETEFGEDIKDLLNENVFKKCVDEFYEHEEKLKLAKIEMWDFPQSLGDRNEYSEIWCEECCEETIIYPDPRLEYGRYKCYFCGDIGNAENCERCGEVFFVKNEEQSICEDCWQDLMGDEA